MTTIPITISASPPPNYTSSPENFRSAFYTNLLLLGVEEHSSQASRGESNHDEAHLLQQQHHNQQQQQQSRHVIIDSTFGYSSAAPSRPLDLHRHVFAKGHQSTKALEFVFWFLFTKLDKTLARERFRDCWPIQDRHDAREFRNVIFKWLEDLRKEGCFSIGLGMQHQSEAVTTAATSTTTAASSSGGLGLFLPTIRRSYLDDSIGERIEQMVLVLSTHVLSRVVKNEQQQGQSRQGVNTRTVSDLESDRTMCSLASQVPVSEEREDQLLRMIDDFVSKRTQQLQPSIENQIRTKQEWHSTRSQLISKGGLYAKEMSTAELDREHFMSRQSIGPQRSTLTTAEETRILDKMWAESMTAAWRPILRDMERYLGSKESLLTQHDEKGSHLELSTVKKDWSRSLQLLGLKSSGMGINGASPRSANHTTDEQSSRLERIRASRNNLENKLKESRRTVGRLQREKNITDRPYYRLLPYISGSNHQGISSSDATPGPRGDACREATSISRMLFSSLAPTLSNDPTTPERLRSIKLRALESARQKHCQQERPKASLLNKLGEKDMHNVLWSRRTAPNPEDANLDIRPSFQKVPSSNVLRSTATKTVSLPKHTSIKLNSFAPTIKPPMNVIARGRLPESGSTVKPIVTANLEQPSSSFSKPVPSDLVMQSDIDHLEPSLVPSNEQPARESDIGSKSNSNVAFQIPRSPFSTAERITRHRQASQEKQPNRFLSLAFSGKDQVNKRSADNLPGNSFTAKLKAAVSDTVDPSKPPIKETLDPILSRSIFRPRIGLSKKRRQSFEPPGEKSSEPVPPMVPEAKSRASSNDGNYNTFDDDDDMPIPGTPSKRRRVESTKSVAADLNAFDKDVPLNDENPFMVTAAPPVPKAVRSPGLTLEDLRAPTPKILRTTGGTSTMAMPMMLMHTPQQKLLFQEEMARLSKPSRPFPGLTTPSAPTSDANPFSVSDSPPKKSAFSSSIFSRFRSGHGGGLSKGLDLDRSPISTPTKSSMALSLITPETPSVPGAITSTIRVSPTVVTSAGPDQDQRIIKSSNTRSFSDLSTTATATEMTILPAPKQSTAEQPAPVVPRSTAQDLNRHLPIPSPSLAMPVEIDATFDPTASRNPWGRPPSWKPKSPRMIDMEKKILAEQKARLAASTASSVESPLEPLSAFGSLKVSVYGRADRTKSLSMSSASLSASSLSMTSSRSDRSVHGHPASSHLGASIVESPVEYQVFGESTGRLNIVEDEDTREFSPPAVSPIKNALGDFPVPVLATSTTSSLFKIPTRSTTYGSKSRLVTAIVSRESAQPVSSNNRAAVKGTVQRVSKPIREATNQDQLPQPRGYHKGELLEQQDRAEKLKMENASILDQPTLQDHDFDDERKGEDETVLNFALQPIFGGTGTSKSRRNGFNFSHKTANNRDDHEHDQEFSFGGLFDEDMPEGLDPDEALYDNTEQFS